MTNYILASGENPKIDPDERRFLIEGWEQCIEDNKKQMEELERMYERRESYLNAGQILHGEYLKENDEKD